MAAEEEDEQQQPAEEAEPEADEEQWQDEEEPPPEEEEPLLDDCDGDPAEGEEAPAEEAEQEHGGDAEENGAGPPMIREAYGKKIVNLRQKLKKAAEADRFISQLNAAIEEGKAEGKTVVFEDFDISQNPIPTDQLEAIFDCLADGGVHVERLRAFGCATVDNSAATLLAGWLGGVTEETAPFELHLSDCAITTEGYTTLVTALEGNSVFPTPDPRNPTKGKLPLYMRLENNYIEPEAIQASIDSGTVMAAWKTGGIKHHDTVKMRLMLMRDRDDGTFQQKTGQPPSPENWPAPRPVRDGKGDSKGAGKGTKGSKGKDSDRRDRGSWGKRDWYDNKDREWKDKGHDRGYDRDRYDKGYDRNRSSRAPWQALPAPARSSGRPALDPLPPPPPRAHANREKPRSPIPRMPARQNAGAPRSAPYSAFGSRASSGAAPDNRGSYYERDRRESGGYGGAGTGDRYRQAPGRGDDKRPNDRSSYYSRRDDEPAHKRPRRDDRDARQVRSPVRRPAGGGGGPPPAPRPTNSAWEEHFSEEYQLPYYWNRETGESSWEKRK